MKRVAVIRTVALRDDRGPLFCRNCGDPFDAGAEDASCNQPHSGWRPCPSPSPGRPMVDCGVGGHMYTDRTPRAS